MKRMMPACKMPKGIMGKKMPAHHEGSEKREEAYDYDKYED